MTPAPTSARLRLVHRPTTPRAAVLVLHGGQESSADPTSWRQLSVWRSRLFASAIARAGRDDLAVFFLRYAVRGWNGGAPVGDARWALAQVRAQVPGVPVGVFGYSMGGRVALRLAGDVDTVVTAAAWVKPGDLEHLRAPSRPSLLLHGTSDTMTDPQGSRAAAAHLTRITGRADAATSMVDLDDTHAMMRHARTWHARAAGHLHDTLLGG